MLEWIIITILVLTLVGLMFFINRLVTKISEREDLYETAIEDAVNQIDSRDEYIAKFAETLHEVKRKIQEIDSKEMFVSDDEVGFVYKAINQEIQRLYDFAKKEEQHGKKKEE